jgi:ceramide glucosyltransferase
MMPVTAVRAIVLFASALPLVYYVLAAYSARRYFLTRRGLAPAPAGVTSTACGGPPSVDDFTPPVSILKPVRGLDRTTYDNFASFCRQDYPDYEIVFLVADEEDPAVDVIRQVIAAFPDRAVRLLIGAPELGPSSKVNKLCRLAREARHDLLVISDSDIRVTPGYLRSVVVPFRDPRVGAVTCLYVGVTDGHLASELEAIGIATDFAGGVVTAWQLEGVKFTLGATMATTRNRLRDIGGFEALVAYCAEDFQHGHRVAKLGYRVELAPYVVASECAVRTLRDYVRHQLRWAISTRHSRPWGYAGLALTQGLPWAVAAAAVAPSSAVAAGYFGAYFVLRLFMAWSLAKWALGDVQVVRKWWLLPVRDALAFVVWLAGLFRNRIHWRGREFDVHDGRLIPVATGEL